MRLKLNLLIEILENSMQNNKYSKAYLNLKNVFELEEQEKFKFSDDVIQDFNNLTIKYNNFLNEIPLQVIEKYYNTFKDDLNRHVFIEYNNKEVADMQTINLFVLLEDFYTEIFNLSCKIANLYNLEIKLNDKGGLSEEKTTKFF